MVNFIVGGQFQWPPAREEEGPTASAPTYIDPRQQQQQQQQQQQNHTQQNYQQSQQQTQQSVTTTTTQQTQQQVNQTQQKPVSILKHTQQPMGQAGPSAETPAGSSQQDSSYTPGPGQSVTAPKRGRGELVQQQPGMRVPLCGACEGQIRSAS